MCKNIQLSEETLENYNAVVKSHFNEALENKSKSEMQFNDKAGMANLEFHGPSTFMAVLTAMFLLLGLFLLWHFVLRRCMKPSTDGAKWAAHAARQARLAIRRIENIQMEEAMGPAGTLRAPLPEKAAREAPRANMHGPGADRLPRDHL